MVKTLRLELPHCTALLRGRLVIEGTFFFAFAGLPLHNLLVKKHNLPESSIPSYGPT